MARPLRLDEAVRKPRKLWLVLARDNRMVDRPWFTKREAERACYFTGDRVVGPYVLQASTEQEKKT